MPEAAVSRILMQPSIVRLVSFASAGRSIEASIMLFIYGAYGETYHTASHQSTGYWDQTEHTKTTKRVQNNKSWQKGQPTYWRNMLERI